MIVEIDEKKREVAESLRVLATHLEVDKELVEYNLGLYMGECVDGYDPVSVNDLADLIEPQPERTCQMVGAFDTDELENYQENVSITPEDTLVYRCESCGFEFRYERWVYPKYCPNCGAKVVNDV